VAKQTTSNLPPKAGAAGGNSPVAKKPATAGTVTSAGRRPNAPSIITFFQESKSELNKVTWPTRQETLNLTEAVIAMTVGIAAFLGLVDGALDFIIKQLIGAK
jgi:preprotein translocase subunit SecE